jgi:hypothetical protein
MDQTVLVPMPQSGRLKPRRLNSPESDSVLRGWMKMMTNNQTKTEMYETEAQYCLHAHTHTPCHGSYSWEGGATSVRQLVVLLVSQSVGKMTFTVYVVIAHGCDYAALGAFEGDGFDPEFYVYLDVNDYKYDFEEGFPDIEIKQFTFESENASKTGNEMLSYIMQFCQDYDASKHTDYRIVTEKDLKDYKPPAEYKLEKKKKKRKITSDDA